MRARARQFGQIRTRELRNSARLRQPACKAANAVTRNTVRLYRKVPQICAMQKAGSTPVRAAIFFL
ncbi:MAG: hypothetical protein DME86_07915 [Verrucomicrobia bacterium]|nr:MAG: hypothetical protein DME86_07915 [Verrucomicrobiota bacterium]